jgi:exopolyphosphatase/guanosine-5'-triphosphate,3'-diphosphate pyrophosphatase
MRVGVVDIGTNSTRLLVADVADGRVVAEGARRSTVTRLGEGVDATGRLGDEPMARVLAVLDGYRAELDAAGCDATVAVLTSAVRDAANGEAFRATVRERYGLDARVIAGEEEARLTFLGATSDLGDGDEARVVIDIGGGSTELVLGRGRQVGFHVSLRAGVVRQTERHLHADPPRPEELEALAAEVRGIVAAEVPPEERAAAQAGIAVAGTATSLAAIAQDLEPYDPARAHGFRLQRGLVDDLLARLAALPLAERRRVRGLHPDRAPTIVAGVLILREVMDAFGLEAVTVSEHDILRGAALQRAGAA